MCKEHCEEIKEYEAFRAEQEQPLTRTSLDAFRPFRSYNAFDVSADDIDLNILSENAKIASRFSNDVYVGEVLNRREVYKELRLYCTAHYPVRTNEFIGTAQVEGYIQASSLSELAALTVVLHLGRVIVIDKTSREILESCTY